MVDNAKSERAKSEKAKKARKADTAKSDKPKRAGSKGPKKTAAEANGAGIVEELREAGAKFLAVANSPAGREVIAAGLSIAAVAAQAALSAKRTKAKPAPAKAAEPGTDKPAGSSAGEDALAAVLGNIAELALAKVFPKKG